MAESIPLAMLVQKASEPLMNSLERGKGWVDGHEPPTLPCATLNPMLAPRKGTPAFPPRYPALAGFRGGICCVNKVL